MKYIVDRKLCDRRFTQKVYLQMFEAMDIDNVKVPDIEVIAKMKRTLDGPVKPPTCGPPIANPDGSLQPGRCGFCDAKIKTKKRGRKSIKREDLIVIIKGGCNSC